MTEENIPLSIKTENDEKDKIVKPLNNNSFEAHKTISVLVIVLSIILGIFTGFTLAFQNQPSSQSDTSTKSNSKETARGTIVGSSDTRTFRDCARGQLIKNDGKITTEGSHKLIRKGGEGQSVYLTSSIVDLDQFLHKNIQVCGETNKAQKAGWLIDAGRVKLE